MSEALFDVNAKKNAMDLTTTMSASSHFRDVATLGTFRGNLVSLA